MKLSKWQLMTYSFMKSKVVLSKPTLMNHLSMKEGSLFCFVVMRSTKSECFRSCSWCRWKTLDEDRNASDRVLGVVGKLSMRTGSMTFGLVVQKFLNIEWFLHWKIELNRTWKFRRNWNVPFGVVGKDLDEQGFNGIYLVRFGFRM
jgi:hypothetical protein